MLAAPATVRNSSASGPRPINLARDVRGVLALMDAAFGPVRDWRGQRVLGDRAGAGYGAPFALRLSMFTKGFIPGFVWEEDGRLVGNVSLLESPFPGRYLIANVAVDPDSKWSYFCPTAYPFTILAERYATWKPSALRRSKNSMLLS